MTTTDPTTPTPGAEHRAELVTLAAAHAEALEALTTRKDRLRAAVVAAHKAGLSESEVARLSGVTRMTVRNWCGK